VPLQLLSGGDDDCKNGTCPTVWSLGTDAEEVIVQGFVITDPVHLAELGLPEGEAAVRVPARVLEDYVRAHR
jgi:hypothetical protein